MSFFERAQMPSDIDVSKTLSHAEKRAMALAILSGLPGGSKDIEHLGESDAEALNEQIMNRCCQRARLITSFVDALREPQKDFRDTLGWKKLAHLI